MLLRFIDTLKEAQSYGNISDATSKIIEFSKGTLTHNLQFVFLKAYMTLPETKWDDLLQFVVKIFTENSKRKDLVFEYSCFLLREKQNG